MSLTTHATTGIIISQLTSSPILGFFFAIISHYLLDIIPHGDHMMSARFNENQRDIRVIVFIIFDVLLLIVLVGVVSFYAHNIPLLWAAIGGAVAPDFLIFLYLKNRKKFREQYKGIFSHLTQKYHWILKTHLRVHLFFHDAIQKRVKLQHALTTQLILILIVTIYYIKN